QSCVAFDIQNTITHEVGHFLGLAHDQDPESTMYFSASPGELKKRSLDPGTAQFVCDAYPRGLPSQPCTVRPLNANDPMPLSSGCSAVPGAVLAAAAAAAVALWLPSRRRRRRSAP
ncbi:MAG TPA: matrixin family metalloprotease, partial [Myxococcales bacterium]|nr:matrixin family metalloprotease [Myxococcales bacterium]